MTFEELFNYLNEKTPYEYVTEASPLLESINGNHENELIGEVISNVATGCGCEKLSHEIRRQDVIKALGPLRLKYMKDDAPIEGFRLIEGTVPVIDQAFNDEALRAKQ